MRSEVPRAHAAAIRTRAADALAHRRGVLHGACVEATYSVRDVREPILDGTFPGGVAQLAAVPDRAVLRVPGVASFGIERGERVRVAPSPCAPTGTVERWLNGAVAALLLAQRGEFALHASVVEIDGVGVAVCGPRGVGKSTTALRLSQLGHRLVTDDVSVLTLGGPVMVQPLAHPVRVLPESAERLGLDFSEEHRVPNQAKLALPAPEGDPVALTVIVALAPREGDVMRSLRLSGAEAHWAVCRNVHRGSLYRQLWESDIFAWAGRVVASVPVYRLLRPVGGWTVDEVARAVEQTAARAECSA